MNAAPDASGAGPATGVLGVEAIEVGLLLEAIYQRYGYDYREYQRETVLRRLTQFQADLALPTLSEVIGVVLRQPELFYRLVSYFSVNVTALFRDPSVYAALRARVIPLLRTWPRFKVWDAGCATGEETYSLSLLLREEGLADRAIIYATDLSASALETARAGIYPLEVIRRGSKNYLDAGGQGSLSQYYHTLYNAAVLDTRLRANVTFARHNLAMDASFGEMQMIVCRNVLIYFNASLQDQVLSTFWESLDNGGFLCLGENESLAFSAVADRFEVVDDAARIYKKRVMP